MRDLFETEFKYVSGAGSSPSGPSGCGCSPCPPTRGKKQKNNNGWGNGPDIGYGNYGAPGNSGTNGSPNANSKLYNLGR